MSIEMDEYQNLNTSDWRIHCIAGAISGTLEHTAVYPLDVIKTRIQCLKPQCSSFGKFRVCRLAAEMVQKEGIRSLFRGLPAVIIGAGPAHAAYYTTYEASKSTLSSFLSLDSKSSTLHGFSGVFATLSHDLIMNPMEVIKQRLQVCSNRYAGIGDCFRRISSSEGYISLYRSLPAQLLMNFPFHSINFIVYERAKNLILKDEKYDLIAHFVSGAMSGGVAAAVTTPLDVIKTTLNVQVLIFLSKDPEIVNMAKICDLQSSKCYSKAKDFRIKGMGSAIKTISLNQGFSGFFRGIWPRVLFCAPSCAISWAVYETFKHILK